MTPAALKDSSLYNVRQALWLLGSAPIPLIWVKRSLIRLLFPTHTAMPQCLPHTHSLSSAHTAAAGRHGNTQTPRSLRQPPSQLTYSVPMNTNTDIPLASNRQNTQVAATQLVHVPSSKSSLGPLSHSRSCNDITQVAAGSLTCHFD